MADASVPPAHKTCTICGETKPLEAFSPREQRCKPCNCIRVKAQRLANPEKARAHDKAQYWKDPEKGRANAKAWQIRNRERKRATQHAWQIKNREKNSAKKTAWCRKNVERVRAVKNAWNAKHPEQARARVKDWQRNNPEKKRAQGKLYALRHPDKINARSKRYQARKRHVALSDLTAEQWDMIKDHYGHRCVYCGRKMQRLTQDHIIPLIKGGNHTLTNIVPACRSCNSKKGARAPLIPVQPLLL